ncbi:MAG: ATP-binding cassette domain-containing protein [Halothermotrichaceae bacterium]
MIIFNRVTKNEIKNLSFYVNPGDFIYIHNDSKKSIDTFFKLLNGTIKPTHGVIRFLSGGSYSTKVPRNKIGIVFNDNILLPDRTIEENLKFIMHIKKIDMKYHQNRIKRILEVVDIKKYLNEKPGNLLDHQLLRANIAQAIINYPPVLVLDNPTYKLDEVNTQSIYHLLKRLNHLSITIVLLSCKNNIIMDNDIRKININSNSCRKKGSYA